VRVSDADKNIFSISNWFRLQVSNLLTNTILNVILI